VAIALIGAVLTTALLLVFGSELYGAMGLKAHAIEMAITYGAVLFGGSAFVWLMNVPVLRTASRLGCAPRLRRTAFSHRTRSMSASTCRHAAFLKRGGHKIDWSRPPAVAKAEKQAKPVDQAPPPARAPKRRSFFRVPRRL